MSKKRKTNEAEAVEVEAVAEVVVDAITEQMLGVTENHFDPRAERLRVLGALPDDEEQG